MTSVQGINRWSWSPRATCVSAIESLSPSPAWIHTFPKHATGESPVMSWSTWIVFSCDPEMVSESESPRGIIESLRLASAPVLLAAISMPASKRDAFSLKTPLTNTTKGLFTARSNASISTASTSVPTPKSTFDSADTFVYFHASVRCNDFKKRVVESHRRHQHAQPLGSNAV